MPKLRAILLIGLFASLALILWPVKPAQAQTDPIPPPLYHWVNRSVIVLRSAPPENKVIYRLRDVKLDYEHRYQGKDANGCDVEIHVKVSRPDSIMAPISDTELEKTRAGELKIQSFNVNSRTCFGDKVSQGDVQLFDERRFNNAFYYVNGETIASTAPVDFGGKAETITFNKQTGANGKFDGKTVFLRTGEAECKDFMLVDEQVKLSEYKNVEFQIIDRADNGGLGPTEGKRDKSEHPFLGGQTCYIVQDGSRTNVAGGARVGQLGRIVDPNDDDGGVTDPTQAEPDCAAKGALGWILCPVTEILGGAINTLDTNLIKPLLSIDPLQTSGGSDRNDILFDGWKNMRNLANIFFIIVFLAIIFSQGLSVGLDAYAVKKMLPRLLIAAIAVQISFYIVAFLIDFTNVLGKGIGDLILSPVGESFNDIGVNVDVGNIVGGSLLAAGVTAGALYFGLLAIGPILVAALLLVLTITLVLVFRVVIIYALILVSPLAFVAWVLPNTENLFKRWWSLLLRLLMMYPIIVALFAAGEAFSFIVSGANESDSPPLLSAIASIIVGLAPLFLVTQAFQLGGAALGGIASGLSRMRSGILQPMRQASSQRSSARRQARMHSARTGHLVAGEGRWARIANPVAMGISSPRTLKRKAIGHKYGWANKIPLIGGKGGKTYSRVIGERAIGVQEKIKEFSQSGKSQDQMMMHAISVAGGHGMKGYRKWYQDKNSTFNGKKLEPEQRDTFQALEQSVAPYLDSAEHREAAAYSSIYDGYPTPETFFAMEELSDSPADLRRRVYDMKRKGKALNGWTYGFDVDPKGNGGKGRVIWKPSGVKGFMSETNNRDMGGQKTHAWNGTHFIPADRIDPTETATIAFEKDANGDLVKDANGNPIYNATNATAAVMVFKDLETDYPDAPATASEPERAAAVQKRELMKKNIIDNFQSAMSAYTTDAAQQTALRQELEAGGIDNEIINTIFERRVRTPEEILSEGPDPTPDPE